ncbi:hypothetical protein [Mannheimia haemolytica]
MRKIKLLHVILSLILGLSAAAIGSYPAIKDWRGAGKKTSRYIRFK